MIPGISIVGSDPFAPIPSAFVDAAAVDGFGREPVVVVEIDQDFCNNVYGVSPCTAGILDSGTAQAGAASTITLRAAASAVDNQYAGDAVYIVSGTGAGQTRKIESYVGSTKVATVTEDWTTAPDNTSVYSVIDRPNACFNTFKTCQDTDNFSRGVKTLRFVKPMQKISPEWQAIPSVSQVQVTPGKINAGGQSAASGPLGQRATATVGFVDHPGSDIVVDPYLTFRTYDPLTRGTYWTKWLARNPYFQNRPLRVRFGYRGQAIDSMQAHHFVLDSFEGPDSGGMVRMRGVDVLRLADNIKAQAPTLSTGVLTAALTDSATSFSVTGALLADYEAAGTVRIGEEVMTYTTLGESPPGTLNFSGVTRGTDGTVAEAHDEDDIVQRCLRYTTEKPVDVIYDLLNVWAGISSTLLDYTNWLAENDEWLVGFELSTLITEPTGVATLIGEICEQVLMFLWWDDQDQLIKLQVVRPPAETPTVIDDSANIIMNSQSFKLDPTQRQSQLWLYFLQRNPVEDINAPRNYHRARIRIDADAESDNEFGEQRIKKIFSRWLQTEAQANDVGTRLLTRYRDNPMVGSVTLDAKDRDIRTGDLIQIRSRLFVDSFGAQFTRQFHVIGAEETIPGEQLRLDLQSFEVSSSRSSGRYMEDAAPVFTSASPSELLTGAWYCDDVGLMSDGTEGWVYQ